MTYNRDNKKYTRLHLVKRRMENIRYDEKSPKVSGKNITL